MDIEQLTAEMAWIRRLAYALVKDQDVAADITQEAWLAAHDRIPQDRPLRPWLARVVLNVTRMRSRSETRRALREEVAQQPDTTREPTADALIDRVELQRELADAVLGLSEPSRSTVLLHYFEGLSSAEIARRLGIADGTVRRRLKVALDELRAHFARRDRRGVYALAPLAGLARAPLTFTVGGFTMKKLSLGIAGLLILVLVLVGTRWKRGEHRENASTAAAKTQGKLAGASANAAGADSASPQTAPWLVQAGVGGRRIAGRVMSEGKPVGGAVVRLGNVTSERVGGGGVRIGDELRVVIAGADGSFDFGIQPAATLTVSAEAADKTPAFVVVAAADPTAVTDPIVLELLGCRSRLFGTIVDASGGGVAKARLSVAGLGGTDASEKGEYSMCVPAGDSRVRIVADGYGALDLPIHLVGALRRDFELVPEAVITGIVVDEANAPVPFARVIVVPQAIERPHFLGEGSTVSDAGGKFRLANLAPGRFVLAAVAEGLGTSAPKPAVAAPGSANREVTLVLTPRARISGHVMMGDKPVGGARVAVANPTTMLTSVAFSQPDGSFTLDGVAFGSAKIVAGPFDVVKPKMLAVDRSRIEGVTVEVTEMAALKGRVLRKGAPVADAVIQTTLNATTRSDAKGEYELRGLPPGDLQITAQAYGATNAYAPFSRVTIAAGKVTEHDIELTGGAEVHGTVVDEQGMPVPNVYVRMIEPKGDLGESMTDANGAFACTAMLGGADYRVAVFPSPGARTAFPPATAYGAVTLKDGDTVLYDVKIAIKNERLSIAGRVVDENGAAIADVHVEAIGRGFGGNPAMLPSVRADVDGSFVVTDLARGTYTLHAHAGDGSDIEMPDVPAGAKGIELKLVRPGSIEGQLVGFSTTPRVHARQLTASLALDNEGVIEGDRFSITGLMPGKYIVEALGEGQDSGQSVVVKGGQATKVTLKSEGRGTVQGTVTEFTSGAPLRGMACVAAQSLGGQAGDVSPGPATTANTTDATGAFNIAAPIGKARVMCFSPDGSTSPAGGDVEVTAAAPGKIDLKAVRTNPPPCEPTFRIKPLTLPLVIASVDPQGSAKEAGLLPGDRVVTIDGASVAGLLPGGAMMLAFNHRPGSTLTLGVERNGAPLTMKITVAAQTN